MTMMDAMADDVQPEEHRSFLPVRYDVVFCMFFANENNKEQLTDFLKSILDLPEDEYESIDIVDPRLSPDYSEEKFAVIDLKLHTKSKKIIHIEVQLQVRPGFKGRVTYYTSKLVTSQLGIGDEGKYEKLSKAISIIITEEVLIKESPAYHHRFVFYDRQSQVEFSDIMEIRTLELTKLPESSDGTKLYDWTRFISADSDKELDDVANSNPQIKEAVVKLRAMSADEQARDMYERRLKGMRDMHMHEDWARGEGIKQGREQGLEQGVKQSQHEIARRLLKRGWSLDEAVEVTGLAQSEAAALQNENSQKSP